MTDKLEELESLLDHAGAVAERLSLGDALAHAQHQILTRASLPDEVERCAEVLEQLTPLPAADGELARQTAAKLTNDVTELQAINDREGLSEIQHALRDASTTLTALRTVLVTTWKERAKVQFGSLATIAGVLERIENTHAFGRELGAWARSAPVGSNAGWFPSASDVEQLKRMRDELPDKVASLQGAGIDAGVQSFLLAVAEGKATLASVSAVVLQWLAANGASTRFAVTAIATNSSQASRRGERA